MKQSQIKSQKYTFGCFNSLRFVEYLKVVGLIWLYSERLKQSQNQLVGYIVGIKFKERVGFVQTLEGGVQVRELVSIEFVE